MGRFSFGLDDGGAQITGNHRMTYKKTGEETLVGVQTDLERAKTVFDGVLDVIFLLMEDAAGGKTDAAKLTLMKLSDLQRAYLGVKEAERAFNDKTGNLNNGDIDFDALRDEIGGRLDRLRAARGANSLS